MTLPLAACALLLALRAAGDDPPVPSTGETRPGAPTLPSAEDEGAVPASARNAQDDFAGPAGVPYLPTVGPPPEAKGIFLDLALLAEVRARTLAEGGESTWASDLEVTPGVALEARTPRLTLSLGYAPRLSVPIDAAGADLAVLHRATARVSWVAAPTWTLSAIGIAVVGENSQLLPASTPGGAGPTPPVFNPVRTFQTYPYVGIDTLGAAEGVLSPRVRLRLAAGWFDVGGTGAEGEAAQPRTWGPQAEGAVSVDAGPAATLATWVDGRAWTMSGGWITGLATLTERWTQRWSEAVETTLTLGAGLANRDVDSRAATGHLAPVARVALSWRPPGRHPVSLLVEVSLWPYYDTWSRLLYQRVSGTAALDWQPGAAWRLRATLTAAWVPATLQVPESYGTAGVSASFAPAPFVTLSLGGFTLSQFQGGTGAGAPFAQWTGYLSLALSDRLTL